MSFWQAKTKVRGTDIKYSLYRRAKANWVCECCGKDCSDDHHNLTTSHFFGRRKESVRFDDENTDAFCRKCHMYYEEHKNEYKTWKLDQLGRKKYDALVLRANTAGSRDDELQKIINKELMKSLEKK